MFEIHTPINSHFFLLRVGALLVKDMSSQPFLKRQLKRESRVLTDYARFLSKNNGGETSTFYKRGTVYKI